MQNVDLVDIYTENGDVFKFPVLLLCIHSEIIASILSELRENETSNLTIPCSVEVMNCILQFCIDYDASNLNLQTKLAYEMLGIKWCDFVSKELNSNTNEKWETTEGKENSNDIFELGTEHGKINEHIISDAQDESKNNIIIDSSTEFIEEIQTDGKVDFICNFCQRPFGSKRWLNNHIDLFHLQ
jgi:hypothetical protein